jgi:hypothetical protein
MRGPAPADMPTKPIAPDRAMGACSALISRHWDELAKKNCEPENQAHDPRVKRPITAVASEWLEPAELTVRTIACVAGWF